jgi:hypothetical protein
MLSYIEICTLIYDVFLRLSKISQKADYLTKGNNCTQDKSVYTEYIRIHTNMTLYILVYTRMNA